MHQLCLKKFIDLKAPLLITGPTGTGKSFLAQKIFENSKVYRATFLTAHLASFKEDLIESELFGHRKGAFTGALEHHNGYLKNAAGGTLFLDEIGELSLEAQKKLLYLMEERKFTPVGSSCAQDFSGRIIMATNKDLEKMVEEGSFREDLYYRIKLFTLDLPSISENHQYLQEAINKVLNKLKVIYQSPYSSLSAEATEFLLAQKWRGNFRELKNTLEYALVMAERNVIEVSDFPSSRLKIQPSESGPDEKVSFIEGFPENFSLGLECFEKMYLQLMLVRNGGRVNETARRLGISKTTLIQKAKKYQINTLKIRAEASVRVA